MKPDAQAPRDTNRWLPHRMTLVTVVLLAAFGAVCWRLYQVQCVDRAKWAARGQDMLRQKRTLHAMRGAIRDRSGELLAHDKAVHDLWINVRHLRDYNDVRARLARLEAVPVKELTASSSADDIFARYLTHVTGVLAQGLREIGVEEGAEVPSLDQLLADPRRMEFPWLSSLQDDRAAQWRKLLEDNRIIAVTLRQRVKRFYPCSDRLTHVLGYVNDKPVDPATGRVLTAEEAAGQKVRFQQVGIEGIEVVMNGALTGTDGYQWIERDRQGRELTLFRGEAREPVHGQEVVLTIDMHLQDTMEEVLEEAYALHQPQRITAVLIEVKTGGLLAMASRPHIQRDKIRGVNANLAVGGQYEPGSVFKVITYAAALDAKLTWLDEPLNCDPNQRLLQKVGISDHYSGILKTSDAFALSSNRAAYILASRLGEKRFLESVKKFGFGRPTGIPLTGESSGTVHQPGSRWWDGLTFSRMSYGHALQVTPLQMCLAVAAIGNKGLLMKPQIIRELRDARGATVKSFAPEAARRVCSEKAADLVRRAMIGVVEHPKGTGAQAAVPGTVVAGKTGTSQLYTKDGGGIRAGHYCVSFAGFAPAHDPELCAIIVVDDPKAGKEDVTGGKLAAPIFSQLMQRCLQNIAIAQAGRSSSPPPAKGTPE